MKIHCNFPEYIEAGVKFPVSVWFEKDWENDLSEYIVTIEPTDYERNTLSLIETPKDNVAKIGNDNLSNVLTFYLTPKYDGVKFYISPNNKRGIGKYITIAGWKEQPDFISYYDRKPGLYQPVEMYVPGSSLNGEPGNAVYDWHGEFYRGAWFVTAEDCNIDYDFKEKEIYWRSREYTEVELLYS